jgi:murein DD-endopeptidase MepM/ murein hydrolase activator NlpD
MDWRKWGRRPSTLVVAFFGFGVCAGVASVVLFFDPDAPSVADPLEVDLAETSPAVALADVSLAPPILPAVLIPAAPAPIALQATTPEIAEPQQIPPAPETLAPRISEAELRRGDTLASSMGSRGVSGRVVDRIAREMIGHFDFRRSQPGHSYRLVQDENGEIESFRYRTSSTVSYELIRVTDGNYEVVRNEAQLWPRQVMIAGIVTSSLYGAITDLGAGAQLANDFTDVFAYDVDFSRMVKTGDEFRILYERLFRIDENGEEVFVRPGQILAARYGGAAGEYSAVYFEPEEGRGGYYRPDGSSVERQFLMAPLRYARVSSRYSAARRHPILKVTRPHHGIDYAAPTGTPVFAVAKGEVIYKSWAGGYGNLVKIRHDNGYVSYYGHLSRFPDGLSVGDRVGQKQQIGYVGSTGLSTGPHVCFRVAKDGKFVNPIRMPSPEGPPLPDELQASFQAHRDTLLASLDSGSLVTSDEAL